MSIPKTEKIWHNGKFIHWDDAKIHVLSHVVNYGSAVFEGIRCYKTTQGPPFSAFANTCSACSTPRTSIAWTLPSISMTLCQARLDLVRANKVSACYIRPIVLRGYGDVGRRPARLPIEVYMACWEWGKYLGEEALRNGVDVCVSSWNRPAPNTLPQMAKAAANYMNSQLIRMEAKANGYAEGIALDVNGYVSEGSGENIFVVMNGTVHTPPLAQFGAARDHARLGDDALPRTRHSRRRADDPARDALHRRRSFLQRHRRRSHARFARSTASRSAPARAARSQKASRKNFSPSPAAKTPTATLALPSRRPSSQGLRPFASDFPRAPSSVL